MHHRTQARGPRLGPLVAAGQTPRGDGLVAATQVASGLLVVAGARGRNACMQLEFCIDLKWQSMCF